MFGRRASADNARMTPLVMLLLSAEPTVAIPLDQYEQLMHRVTPKEPRALTVVDAVHVAGSLVKGVTVSIEGRAFGARPDLSVMEGTLALESCAQQGVVLSRNAENDVVITPLAERFSARCRLSLQGSGPWTFRVRGVVDVGGAVLDGAVRVHDVSGGVSTVELSLPQPKVAPPAEAELPASVAGRYRVTLQPGETRFRWELAAHNPNPHAIHFALQPRSGESIERLETTAAHEVTSDGWSVDLPPGDTQLVATGVMPGSRFEPPIDAAGQFVLVDVHPLLRVEVTTDAKRISPAETGLSTEYRAAQALLLARGQQLSWSATLLETLPSARYTVSSLTGTYFVGPEGGVAGDTDIKLMNEGAAELPLPMRSTPTSASIAGKPVPLTSSKDGELRLPLAQGENVLHVQHRGMLKTAWGFAAGTLEVPGVGAEVSTASLELRTGSDWLPLMQKFGSRRWLAVPTVGALMMMALYAFWMLRVLVWLGAGRRTSFLFALLGVPLSASDGLVHWALMLALSLASALWAIGWMRKLDVQLVAPPRMMSLALATFATACVLMFGVTLFGDNVRRLFGMSADALAGDDNVQLTHKSLKSFGGGGSDSYQGLGAELEVPLGKHMIALEQELAPAVTATSASVLLVSASLAHAGFVGLNFAVLALLFALRRALVEGVQRQLRRVFEARMASSSNSASSGASGVVAQPQPLGAGPG
jgi:hypothetical protein